VISIEVDSILSWEETMNICTQLLWALLLAASLLIAEIQANNGTDAGLIQESGGQQAEPGVGVLFPWFAEIMGTIVFYMLTRYCTALPYTAVMFLIGTFMGIGILLRGDAAADLLSQSALQWVKINGEVLLLVFLPGLIFRDAFGLNVHLFIVSFSQCWLLAFPMVLAGTVLTALVAYYIFPFGWSFNLAMTFGSILAATDPVAVSALLNEVGAPPRLKMHISGESLLNDGSSIVFYTIFSSMFLTELNIEGFGETIDFGKGVALFFQMSIGGMLIGLVAAVGLGLVLYMLSRRLNDEENVAQVAATITMAYLTYILADFAGTSGVIAVVFLGVATQAFASSFINKPAMMDAFWQLVEYLLNTLLFTLGGIVWGSIIADVGTRNGYFNATEWGYLILLFILLNIIRTFLIFSFYPITSRIGLKSNVHEAIFASFGGLRGAVGISLAISLDNEVWEATEQANTSFQFRQYTTELFGMVGGIAFFSLVINGTLAGPLLRYLHLADVTETREKIVENFKQTMKEKMVVDFIELLTDYRFRLVDYAVVRAHVPMMENLTLKEVKEAVLQYQKAKGDEALRPNLKHTLPYLQVNGEVLDESFLQEFASDPQQSPKSPHATFESFSTHENPLKSGEMASERLIELRQAFLALLRAAYNEQIKNGELEARDEFITYVLFQGLEFTADDVANGKPLNDWETSLMLSGRFSVFLTLNLARLRSKIAARSLTQGTPRLTFNYQRLQLEIHRAFVFVHAHKTAQNIFRDQFFDSSVDDFSDDAKQVILESKAQYGLATVVLREHEKEVKVTTSHLFCTILLNKAATRVESVEHSGLLKEGEASELFEGIQKNLFVVRSCSCTDHGEINDAQEENFYKDQHLNCTSIACVNDLKGMTVPE